MQSVFAHSELKANYFASKIWAFLRRKIFAPSLERKELGFFAFAFLRIP